jgi:hypothetical protein
MRHPKRAIWIAVLPTTHLCLCGYVAVTGDVWKWMELSLLDFPLVYVQKYVGDRYGLFLISPWNLTIFGTVWWLCVGVALSFIFEWLVRLGGQHTDEGQSM